MHHTDRSTLAAAFAVWLATFTVLPLTTDLSFLTLSWLLLVILSGTTLALRRAGLRPGAVLATQLALWLGFLLALNASLPGGNEPWYQHFVAEWVSGVLHMQTQAAPMEPNNGVTLIFVCVVGLVAIVTDLLVSGLRHPVWAIAPLAVPFLVPAIGLGTDTGIASFLCIALGYLAILVAGGLNATAGWTRGLSSDSERGHGSAAPVVWRAAALIGAPALVLTMVLGLLLPTFVLPGFGFGSGPGGNGALQLADPTLDLRRNLTQPRDEKVIEYRTNRPGGTYLRMASLPSFTSAGWGHVPMELSQGDDLSPIPGLSEEPSKRRTTTIKVLDFKSEYLPLPFAPRRIEAAGSWAFDEQSLVMLSMAERDRPGAIQNLTYTVESVDIAPDVDELGDAAAGTPSDSAITGLVPPDLPQSLKDLTAKVIGDADTAPQRAAAIQRYLRDTNRFTYTTEALPGSGYQALVNFLTVDNKGYCEQFATAMAMMARVAGIPSRVAVGFLPGERRGDRYDVMIRNMHAWPELYFAGFGWVRFEPTPGSITGSAPAWTLPSAEDPTDEASAAPSAEASSSASDAPLSQPTLDPAEQSAEAAGEVGFPWAKTLLGSALSVLALLILAAPATIRMRRRTARLAADRPAPDRVEAAWEEIRDTVLDYGGSWPQGSPRMIGGEIGQQLQDGDSDTMTVV
ncbi:MAG TPA: DUF3488 and transglutaminase-like domain-containing protein, partial [Propionibacteriaceae bacterium]